MAYAQSPQAPQTPPGQAKKQAPSQTVDHGASDAARDLTPAEAATVDQLFGKNASGVSVSLLPNGLLRADLDESFMDAMTVTMGTDGKLQFGEVKGLKNAEQKIKAAGADPKAAKPIETKKPATKLEEKD
jgi:hypothetical protein